MVYRVATYYRITTQAAIRKSCARSHPRNFVSAPVAGPTATRRRCARFCRMGAPRARGAARAGRYLVPWDTGTECACLRARKWQSEAVPARCHSGVHSVWGRKKGRFKRSNVKAFFVRGATSPHQLHGSTCSLCILLQNCILHHYISPHATRETVSPTLRSTAMTSTCRVPL